MKQHFRLVVGLIGVVLDACSGPVSGGTELGRGASAELGTDATTSSAYDTPLTCTSATYTGGGESPNMNPGGTCISCHTSSGEGPRYRLAGTVYPSAHEPDDCNGVDGTTSGAQVIVSDATGMEIVLSVNSVGNFYSRETFTAPFVAKVVLGGQERVMLSPQQSGDCNSCHSESGANQAPGRIMLP